jgi:hypothetical protein
LVEKRVEKEMTPMRNTAGRARMAWKREAVRVICWGRVKVDIFSVLFYLALGFGLDLDGGLLLGGRGELDMK